MKDHQSEILSIVDRGSKILTGSDTDIIFFPSINYRPAYFIKSKTKPSLDNNLLFEKKILKLYILHN